MRVRTLLTIAIAFAIFPVLFTMGAWPILGIDALEQYAAYLLPAVIVIALIFAPVLGWYIAPRMRLKYWRKHGRKHSLPTNRDKAPGAA